MKPAGYLISTREGLAGEPGLFYDYILAGNGLFVRARSSLLVATVRIAEADIRGLLPLEVEVELPKGLIPRALYNLASSILFLDPTRERYLAITWDEGYHLEMPAQDGHPGRVSYRRLPDTVLDIHSHGTMGAFFSGQDDQDEQGLRLFMVVGKMDTLAPEISLRVGVYGYFSEVGWGAVFV